MSISKDVIKQCLISKQREVDESVIVNRLGRCRQWKSMPRHMTTRNAC